jgi:threonine dehydrogenase-like Zn-dependent dehydrogenase
VRFADHGTLDGALQQHLVWPDSLLHPLPDELSDDAGALLEPLGVAIHAVGATRGGGPLSGDGLHALYDASLPPEDVGAHPFEKWLVR